MDWLKNLVDSLERSLDKPPYLVFFFSGTLFVTASILMKFAFEQTWVFLIYSTIGFIWRYIERDFMSTIGRLKEPKDPKNPEKEKPKFPYAKLWIISIYHVGNLVLLYFLLNHLDLI